MQRILHLIEETLDADVTPQELADQAGYSLWHFLHLFRQEVGCSLCRYRTARRLRHALYQVQCGARITDAALRWGFDTHSGLYRACMREHGLPPREYLRTHRVNPPSVPLLKEEVFRMLNRDRFQEALSHWGLQLPLTPVTYPDSGHVSDNAMYAGDQYVLKACLDEHISRLSITLSDVLLARGIPAAEALPLPTGDRVLPLDGFFITLCRRIPGAPMRAAQLLATPEDSGLRIGKALAELHLAAAEVDEAALADDEPYADHLLGWALPKALEALPGCVSADYADHVDALRTLPVALVHHDPNPANLIDAGDAIGFIDFDLSHRCVRIFDPCYTATAVLSEVFERAEGWQDSWPVFCKALLTGYDSVSPLTPEEKQAVHTMLVGNELLCLAAFAGSSKFRHVFEINARMLPWLQAHLPTL